MQERLGQGRLARCFGPRAPVAARMLWCAGSTVDEIDFVQVEEAFQWLMGSRQEGGPMPRLTSGSLTAGCFPRERLSGKE